MKNDSINKIQWKSYVVILYAIDGKKESDKPKKTIYNKI
jgi:hypothetical protein